jgi:hypothetical protein
MARKRAGGNGQTESISGYFRRLFEENPDYLRQRSNAQLLQRWLADHPGHTEVPKNVINGMTNVKSLMRRKFRIRARRRRGRPAKTEAAAAPVAAMTRRAPGGSRLEELEEHIDDCLIMAKSMDRDGLANVIKLLHRARNEVVWMQGEP